MNQTEPEEPGPEEIVSVTVRMPYWLQQKIDDIARRERRSRQGQVVVALESWVASRGDGVVR